MARKMKVLWLIKGLGLGGAEKLLALSVPYINRDRFEYSVAYFLPWKNALVPHLEQGGVPAYCLDQKNPCDPRGFLRLVQLLRELQPDVLHMHLPYPAITGRIAARLLRVPATVYTEHQVMERYNRLTAFSHRMTYRWSDATIFVSEAVRRSIEAHCRLNGRMKLRTIYNGVDWEQLSRVEREPGKVREEFKIPRGHSLIITVASFTPKKRHEDLLQAARIVLDQYPQVTFLLVGDGPLRSQMERLADTLGIWENVRFAGSRPDALHLMAAGDLFVLPSIFEAFGIALLEALALQLPIIATRVGGIPEVIKDNSNGFLVDPGNPQMLADRILLLLHHPELGAKFAENAERWWQRQFDISEMVRSVEAIYDEVLAQKGYNRGEHV